MGRVSVSEEVRKMRFGDIMERYEDGRLLCEEAADILGMSVSSFYRWRQRYEAQGIEGLVDGRLGKLSGRRTPVDVVTSVLGLYTTRYFDFNVRHFHEKLVAEHGIKLSYTWVKNTLQAAGKVGHAKRRGAHRLRRPRKPSTHPARPTFPHRLTSPRIAA